MNTHKLLGLLFFLLPLVIFSAVGEGVSDVGTLSSISQNYNPCPGTPTVTYSGKTYNTVQIGAQCWLKENLDVGIMIQSTTGGFQQTDNGTIEKYCYDNDPANCTAYGGLYEWTEAMQYTTNEGAQGICPDGWHIPTYGEFFLLRDFVDALKIKLLKVGETNGADNETGFSALLTGYRGVPGSFHSFGSYCSYWGSTLHSTSSEFAHAMGLSGSGYPGDGPYIGMGGQVKSLGFNVRCLKDDNNSSGLNLNYNQIESVDYPEIKSYVTVSDGDGNPISGLTSSNFTVKEGGTTQSPITVTQVGSSGSNISVALVLDKSGSMDEEISDAKTAAVGFVNNMQSGDKGAVVSFGSSVVLNQGFTTDKTSLINAINSISASDGSTMLYDGIYEGISQTSTQSGRKAIICLTDGENNDGSSKESDVISYANQLSFPVYTVGLGLSQGSSAEQSLQNISSQTGGQYYYAPNSNDLSNIYQSISESIDNQYLITYTSSDPTCGGNERTVNITADYNGSTDTKTKTYTPPACGSNGNIKPVSPAEVTSGNEFWVDIKVGDPNQVSGLFGVSFKLKYATTYLDYVTAESNSWFGSDLVFYPDNNDGSGEVSIGISRKYPASGVNGSGVLARVKFVASNSTPNNTQVSFSITDIEALNSSGGSITLTPLTSSTSIISGLDVWPGDANNDGIVNQADVLPLGMHWSRTGSSRNNASMQWSAQLCQPWSPEAATYADCNGDGVVNQADVLAIGMNWSKTHTLAKSTFAESKKYEGEIKLVNLEYDGNEVVITLDYEGGPEAKELRGLSFAIKTSNGVEIVGVEEGSYFGEEVLSYLHNGAGSSESGYGIVRKSEKGEVDLYEAVGKIRVKMTEETKTGLIELFDVKGINESGRNITIKGNEISVDNITGASENLPLEYGLKQNYPNPFNPTTTIEYSLKNSEKVRLSIYNMLGEEIKVLVDKYQGSGSYGIQFDASDLPSGVYLYKLITDNYTDVKKLTLVK